MNIKHKDLYVFLILWAGYFLIGIILNYEFVFYSPEGVFLLEKAQLALRGVPPRLENIGLVYPPLPFFLFLPFSFMSGPIASILISTAWGALAVTVCIRYLRWTSENLIIKLLITFAFIINPVFLFVMYAETSLTIYISLFVIFIYLFFRFYETRIPYYIVLAGVVLGVMTSVRYDTFIVTMIMVPFVPFLIYERGGEISIRRILSLALMLTLPTMMILGSWVYINWIFQGDPLHFLYSPYSYFKQTAREISYIPQLVEAKGNFAVSVWVVLKLAFYAFPAFFVVLLIIRTPILFIAAILPIAFQVISVLLGVSAPSVTWFSVLIPITVIISFYYINSSKYNKIYAYILVVVMYFSLGIGFYSLISSPRDAEYTFAKILINKKNGDIFEQEKKVADYLKLNVRDDEHILIDDAVGYPIVCFFNRPSQFFLPYQYDYFKFLQQPAFFANYIVVPRAELTSIRFDQLTNIHPDAFTVGFNHTILVFQTQNWRVYKSLVYGMDKKLEL